MKGERERAARHLRAWGRVQGVGFRAWAAAEAGRLGIDGWVRNRRDGSVEAVVAGPPERVEEMVRLFRRGPALARVERLEEEAWDGDPGPGFYVLPTV